MSGYSREVLTQGHPPMLAHHRRPVCLSLISTDLPILSTLETSATLYQRDRDRFHILLNQPLGEAPPSVPTGEMSEGERERFLWLEISPYRAILTMQGKGKFAYRHFWEKGIYGVSRYWFNRDGSEQNNAFRLRNFTRSLKVDIDSLPRYLRVEYELWTGKVQLGHYALHLEIYH